MLMMWGYPTLSNGSYTEALIFNTQILQPIIIW